MNRVVFLYAVAAVALTHCCEVADTATNHDLAHATPLTSNVPVSERAVEDHPDFFRFPVTAGLHFTVQVTPQTGQRSDFVAITLSEESGAVVLHSGGMSCSDCTTATINHCNTYSYAVATAYAFECTAPSTGTYSLEVLQQSAADNVCPFFWDYSARVTI